MWMLALSLRQSPSSSARIVCEGRGKEFPLSMLSSPSSSAQAFAEANVGEWAGWQCEFKPDGTLLPVDDRYLDAATIEYGMQPAGFEILCTAAVEGGELQRRFLRILPAEGCACDNLAAEMSVSRVSSDSLDAKVRGDATLRVFTLDDPPGDGGANPDAMISRHVSNAPE